MATYDPHDPGEEVLAFFGEYHLATLTLIKADGEPHVTAVGFTYEPERALARVITWADSWKARHTAAANDAGSTTSAVIGTVDGGRWLALYGQARVTDEAEAIAQGVASYAQRYRQPKERDDRVVIEITVDKIVGRA